MTDGSAVRGVVLCNTIPGATEQVRQIDAYVERHLLPGFGYGEEPATRGQRSASA